MRTINTLAELKAERERLYARQAFLEAEIQNNYKEIKDDLKPLHLIAKGAGKMLSSKDNSLVGNSFGFVTKLLLKKVLLKDAGFLTRMVVPFLAKNVASNFGEENKSRITEWITDMISKFKNRKSQEDEPSD